jgi:hypothetical protein
MIISVRQWMTMIAGVGSILVTASAPAGGVSKCGPQRTGLGSKKRGAQVKGLQASLMFACWIDDNTAAFKYSLRFVHHRALWLLKRREAVTVYFWDNAGKPVGRPTSTWVIFGQDFLEGKVDVDDGPVFAAPPIGTHSVSVALGEAGPVTAKVQVPARPKKPDGK